MLIIVLSVRAWRKTAMAVPRLSTLVLVEPIYSMSGVVSVSLCPVLVISYMYD